MLGLFAWPACLACLLGLFALPACLVLFALPACLALFAWPACFACLLGSVCLAFTQDDDTMQYTALYLIASINCCDGSNPSSDICVQNMLPPFFCRMKQSAMAQFLNSVLQKHNSLYRSASRKRKMPIDVSETYTQTIQFSFTIDGATHMFKFKDAATTKFVLLPANSEYYDNVHLTLPPGFSAKHLDAFLSCFMSWCNRKSFYYRVFKGKKFQLNIPIFNTEEIAANMQDITFTYQVCALSLWLGYVFLSDFTEDSQSSWIPAPTNLSLQNVSALTTSGDRAAWDMVFNTLTRTIEKFVSWSELTTFFNLGYTDLIIRKALKSAWSTTMHAHITLLVKFNPDEKLIKYVFSQDMRGPHMDFIDYNETTQVAESELQALLLTTFGPNVETSLQTVLTKVSRQLPFCKAEITYIVSKALKNDEVEIIFEKGTIPPAVAQIRADGEIIVFEVKYTVRSYL